MKKALAILLPMLAAISLTAQETRPNMEIKQFEEQKVESNREFYGDLPARMTKVVIAGDNSMTDLIFKNAVEESWNISPFEFCSYDEFDRIKTDTNYYFLMRLDKMHRSESDPAMEFICFLKGNEKAADNISAMPELIALPLFPADDNSDRIYTYLPAYMNIIQNYLQKIVDGRIYPSKRGVIQTGTFDKNRNTKVLFRKGDLAYEPAMQEFERMFRGRADQVSQDEIDKALETGAPNTLVSLVVAPSEIYGKAFCYKMIISADTYELLYWKRHKLNRRKGPGFLKSDLRRISRLITPEFKAVKVTGTEDADNTK